MKIFLVRHPKVKVGPNVCYGSTDVELAEGYEETALRISRFIQRHKKERDRTGSGLTVYSSGASRCIKVAEIISGETGNGKISIVNDLNEMDFGNWELTEWSAIDREEFENWMNDFVHNRVPGGESFIEQAKRVLHGFFGILLDTFMGGGDTVIVAHGATIRIIIAEILGIPLENIFMLSVDYGSVSLIKANFTEQDFAELYNLKGTEKRDKIEILDDTAAEPVERRKIYRKIFNIAYINLRPYLH